MFHDFQVNFTAELACAILVNLRVLLAQRRSLMHTHDQLAREVVLAVEALVDEMILGRHVQPLKVDVLLKFLQDNLLLCEFLMQVPYVKPVL